MRKLRRIMRNLPTQPFAAFSINAMGHVEHRHPPARTAYTAPRCRQIQIQVGPMEFSTPPCDKIETPVD